MIFKQATCAWCLSLFVDPRRDPGRVPLAPIAHHRPEFIPQLQRRLYERNLAVPKLLQHAAHVLLWLEMSIIDFSVA